MKKTVRLTEADLIRLVKRVVNEQEEGLPGYEEFKDDIDHFFPDADWSYADNDTVIFADDNNSYVGYFKPSGVVDVSRALFINELGYNEPINTSYIKRWVEESIDLEVNDVIIRDFYYGRPRNKTKTQPVNPDMSLSEFTKKFVPLQHALFKKLGVPFTFSFKRSKMDAKEIFEREPGKLKELINQMSEILKSV